MKRILGLILLICHADAYSSLLPAPTLRVRIAESLNRLSVSGYDIQRYIWPKKSSKKYEGFKKIQFNCKSKKRSKTRKPIRLASINSQTGFMNWEKNKYRGTLHIQTSEKFNGCDIINEISLEDYLSTLLPKEMNSKWPIEALKAQAVAARSYAYYKIKTDQVSRSKGFSTNYDIENSEKHQVSGTYYDATRKTVKATTQTRGEVLTLVNNGIVPIFFHSKCGGRTLTPEQVWKTKVKGYQSVTCPFCHEHGKKNWELTLKKRNMAYHLERALKVYNKEQLSLNETDISFRRDTKSSTLLKFYNRANLKTIKKSNLRSILGRRHLPSNYYNLKVKGDRVVITGSGYGHGVGMCQFGAKELALKGFTYKQILAHYFPRLVINKIY